MYSWHCKIHEGKVRVLECIESHFDFVWVICCLWMLQRVWNDLSHWLTSFSQTWTLLCSIMSQAAYPPAGPGYAYRPGQGYPPGEAAQNMFKLGACTFLLSLAYSTNCKWCMQKFHVSSALVLHHLSLEKNGLKSSYCIREDIQNGFLFQCPGGNYHLFSIYVCFTATLASGITR